VKPSPFVHRPTFPGLASFRSHITTDEPTEDDPEDVTMQDVEENPERVEDEEETLPRADRASEEVD
jgi:hypothetical protein